MRVRFLLFFISLHLIVYQAVAQKASDYKQPRILLLLDGSSSMVQEWLSGTSRFKAAGNVITTLMDSIYKINPDVEFSLRVYGHQHGVPENNCYDTRREVMFSKNNLTQMSLRLESLKPVGVSPIAYSLRTAAENDFDNERDYTYSLILITDGAESCGGDICEVMQSLLERKIQFRPYIVSLVDYAPLKEQYSCLGNYLQVTKPDELQKAVGTISESYRKMLAVPILKPKIEPKPKSIPLPSALKLDIPITTMPKKEPETTAVVKPAPVVVKDTVAPKPVVVTPPPTQRPSRIVVDTVIRKKETITSIKTRRGPASFKRTDITPVLARRRRIPAINIPAKEEEAVVIVKEQYARIKPSTRIRMLQYFYAIPRRPRLPIPKISYPKKETEAVAITPPRTPIPPRTPPPAGNEVKEAAFTTEAQPAAQSALQLYFTNGRGKYFNTNPRIILTDAKTGKVAKRFFRTTDASGNPDPQQIPPGTYDIGFEANANLVVKNVVIGTAETRKVTVTITNGTLRFEYEPNTKRPMKEFTAVVKRNFEYAPNVTQKCTETVSYEPGNYHIEINTLPPDRRNIDLDFGATYYIRVPEPGFVQFTNDLPKGKVALYYPLGDQYARFYTIDISGNAEQQKLQLQPGQYEAHYRDGARGEIVKHFQVGSNETTAVEL